MITLKQHLNKLHDRIRFCVAGNQNHELPDAFSKKLYCAKEGRSIYLYIVKEYEVSDNERKNNMNIRKAKQDDLPVLVSIYNHAILHTTATLDLEPMSVEARQSWFDKHMNNYFPLIVAEEENIVMGYASLSTFQQKEAFKRTVEISIYKDEEHQGKGLGKQLLAHIIEMSRAFDLHEQFEFVKCGEMKEVGFKFDRWQDVLFYQLIL